LAKRTKGEFKRTVQCRQCNSDNAEGAKFCTECGAAFANQCAKCSKENPLDSKFCSECGTSLQAAFPASPREGAQSAFAPAHAESASISDGERRHLTVLFCDLVGSTEIAARLDPEDWHAIGADYQRSAAEAATRFGGHVAKYLGDGLVVYFGYPKAMEDAAERGARAGLAMVEAMAKLNERFAGHDIKLQVRVGIHTGSVVVAQGGGKEADMFGDAPNIASRVQTAAAPDTVVITAATHALVSGLFVVEDLGAHALKGIAEPTRLYRVAGAGLARQRTFEARSHTPFVGREGDMQLLTRRWQNVRDGEGQLVLVMGEPGIGKSRLMNEFRARLKGDPHLWITCAGQELFNNTPFYSVIQMLDQGLGWRGDESKEERFAFLERGLQTAGLNLHEALPLIAELLDLPLPANYPPVKFSPEQKRKRLFAALAGWVYWAASMQPLVIAMEDLHWVDPSTIELLQLLAEQGARMPLMLLVTARPEFRAPWPLRAHHAQITLNRLNDKQTREIIAGVAARAGLLREVIEGVVKRTDGVPLFAEELTRLMLDSQRQSGAREIPATLQDSLTARLDRLGPAKDVAQIGSVIGREFSYELLRAVSPLPEAALQSSLESLAEADVIHARGLPPDATYKFKHALTQDAAYGALLKSKRRELHARVARTIEENFPEAQPQILARHWTDAGEIEPAIAAWTKAAIAADARSAFREAEEAYRQAHTLLTTLPDTPARDAREIDLIVPLVVVASNNHGWSSNAVTALSERSTVLAERVGTLSQLVLQRFAATVSTWQSGDYARARALADQLLDFAEREGSDFSLRCAQEGQFWTRHTSGDFAGAESHYDAWLRICERAGYGSFPGETTAAFGVAAQCAWHLGRSDDVRERTARSVAFGRQSAVPTDIVLALNMKAATAMMQRDPEAAEAAAAEALAIAEKYDLTTYANTARVPLSWARAHLGQADQSVPIMRKSIAAMIESGTRSEAGDALLRLAHVLNVSGAFAEALTTIELFLKDYPDHVIIRPNALHLRGELRSKLGETDQAEADFRAAIELARQIGTKPPELRAATSLAGLWAAQGKSDEARALLAPIYAWFTDGFDTRDLIEAKAQLGALAG
jgi:class 3 adenylate cyclase/tetratricopeptide (TPR) repeat protein